MGRQKLPIAVVGFGVSLTIVVFVLVGGEGSRRTEVTGVAEDALPKMFVPGDGVERDHQVWLTNYDTHVPLIGVPPTLPVREAGRKSEHVREEAEYAAFIEERMRRLSEAEGR